MTTLQMTRRMPKGASIRDRLEEYSIPEPNSGCWLWLGSQCGKGSEIGNGYGAMSVDGISLKAHRISYEEFVGPIPDGIHVLHRCDTPPCINPGHLFLGTNLDNIHDRMRKGRSAVGYDVGVKSLGDFDILEIARLLSTAQLSQRAIAGRYGISQGMVGKIATGKTWGWLTGIRKELP